MSKIRYTVTVKRNKDILELKGSDIVIGTNVAREKGKANDDVIRKIAKHLRVHISNIKIVKGKTSGHKIIEINE